MGHGVTFAVSHGMYMFAVTEGHRRVQRVRSFFFSYAFHEP